MHRIRRRVARNRLSELRRGTGPRPLACSRLFCLLAATLSVAACSSDLTLPSQNEPATMKIVAGNGQRGPINSWLGQPLVVQVLDLRDAPVPSRSVQFAFLGTSSEAAIQPETTRTDQQGQATTRAKLGAAPGTQVIQAAVVGASSAVQAIFQLFAVATDSASSNSPTGPSLPPSSQPSGPSSPPTTQPSGPSSPPPSPPQSPSPPPPKALPGDTAPPPAPQQPGKGPKPPKKPKNP